MISEFQREQIFESEEESGLNIAPLGSELLVE